MARSRRNLRKFWIGLALVAGIGGFGAVMWLRHEAGGLKNAFDTAYWKERSSGEDEYKPSLAYFRRGPRDKKVVCLTIDDGPHGPCTVEELRTLRDEGIKATFFLVGAKMDEHPDLVRQMIEEGHEVGNHTDTHPRLDKIPIEDAKLEILEAEETFENITGRRMSFFRPPGMHQNEMILRAAKMLGYTTVGWNVGAHDFQPGKKDPGYNPEATSESMASTDQIVQRVLTNVKNGSIILLHDQMLTAKALPTIIKTLKGQGYRFVTCAEALQEIDHPIEVAANPFPKDIKVARREAAVPKEPGAAALREIGRIAHPTQQRVGK